ncbi:MAG: methyltransferase domain-containing protein, partial [Actinomycetes bacterium]
VTTGLSPTEAKACCATTYSSDAVAMVLGESHHPGGLRLTRRLAGLTGLRAGERVLDLASGPGTTALLLAAEFGVSVDGVDLADASVLRATAAATEAGVGDRVAFRVADAERLPLDDATVDAVLCECAFCTFPDKPTAAAEIARVLRPGGRLGFSDVTVAPGGLPAELAGVAGWVACLADARPLEEYAAILAAAGLDTLAMECHDDALAVMVDQIQARLTALPLVAGTLPALHDLDVARALELTGQAARAVAQGRIGYGLLVAARPED